MAASNESESMALFCDFENVALGVRDAKYEKFDIKPVLERLLLKGSIVVKKAYCDWERYKGFKASMHEANFELIEIPHVRQSGKNSADIRLVVDALDLCYTKSHVDTFVIISGDSDFSPLVSKLRENAKRVIGVGVKQSTSDLLVANCDEFIFYDDLVRERLRAEAKRAKQETHAASKRTADEERRAPDDDKRRKDDAEARKLEAVEIAVETFDALVSEQGDGGKIWASVLKSAIKRRKPDFNESYYGFRAFGNLLEEARARGLLDFGRDERSGTYVSRAQEVAAGADSTQRRPSSASSDAAATVVPVAPAASPQSDGRRDKRENRHRDRNERDRRARRQDAPPRVSDAQAAHDEAHEAHEAHSERVEPAVVESRSAAIAPARVETSDVSAGAVGSIESSPVEVQGEADKAAKKAKPGRKTPASKTPARKTAKKAARADAAAATGAAADEVTALSAASPASPASSAADADRTGDSSPTTARQPAKKKAPARSRRPKSAAPQE